MRGGLLESLAGVVGPAHVLRPGQDLVAYERDWRKRYHGRAGAVVLPGTVEEVAAVMRLCHAAGQVVVPQGGNTGLVGGGVPDDTGTELVLSTARLNRVRQVDALNLTLTGEAGCVLQQVQETAAHAGLLFPLSLAAEGSCTLGGNLATNAGGTQVLRYGNARELCLGLEVVLADGRIWSGLSGLRKDNTGYDLRHLFVGSEGTLGIITAAVMKLQPQPAAVLTALATCDTLAQALELLQRLQQRAPGLLTGFEAMNALSLELVARHFPALVPPLPHAPWAVLLEVSDPEPLAHAQGLLEAALGEAIDAGCARDVLVASSLAQSKALWHLREAIPLAQAQEGLNIKHDVAVPVSAVALFAERADAAVQRLVPGARHVTFGHLGDGNLHYNVQAPEGVDAAAFLARHEVALNEAVYDVVQALGGSISAEHGIGRLKRDELAQRKSPVALQLMRSLKTALDPQGILNPGRLLP